MTNEQLAERILDLPTAEHHMGSGDSYDNGFRDGFEIGTQHAAKLVREMAEKVEILRVTYAVQQERHDGHGGTPVWDIATQTEAEDWAKAYRIAASGSVPTHVVRVTTYERREVIS